MPVLIEFALYIRSFLHQTTTIQQADAKIKRCISVLFYIKPQLVGEYGPKKFRCISVLFYIKPQPMSMRTAQTRVVYPFFSTSNHTTWFSP